MNCTWLELTTSRAYREETGLRYKICRNPADLPLGLCKEHVGRFSALATTYARASLRYFENLSKSIGRGFML